ncbi:DNA-binding protein [Halobiforma lacisalsi AJ5]|uniref:Bacterio-opsin activator HTH domain-containing protein n=1 Tax=Natronobacterium lacisalsi AJ5 TaxID=358396 RepID=M0LU19_NATLA|nr:helix-turn-helix domain-containing protein [Halobiforma lacisalsi]APW97579.1 DNA-binding protein [Halobiforma lacisalsi AJ5]EMA37037.1 bacterio-opsin activator HTH domain-containing protein [Halobiforma lacisalsi AJ5]
MSTILEFRLPLAAFPLGVAIEREPSRRVELERIVPTDETALPFFWVWGKTERDAFESDLRERRAVRELEEVSRTDEGRLYRARWNAEIEGFVRGVTEIGGTILRGRGTEEGWRVTIRFGERAAVSRFREYCHEHDVSITVDRIYTAAETGLEAGADGGYELTDEQRETVRHAYEAGYFRQPRGITQTELAEEFGLSQRAISRRLHRGLSRLVGSTVGADLEEADADTGRDGDGDREPENAS